jgi:hypothetical protein
MLKFPESRLLTLAEFWEGLLNQNYIWQILVNLLEVIDVTELVPQQVIGQDCVIEVKNLTQMGVDNESLVINSKVLLSGDLNLHLSELLSNGSPTRVEVVINVLDVDDDEFTESISAEGRLEHMLPIMFLFNLKGLHGSDVHEMNKLRNFVDEHHWADTTEHLGQSLWQDDEIVSTDWCQLNKEGVLVMVRGSLLIMTDELLRVSISLHQIV